jgi:class 3 adenylate cyclase
MEVANWLRRLGLERYVSAFRKNQVDADLLPRLTAEDLKDIGVALVGDRRRLIEAISALRQEATELAAAKPLQVERARDPKADPQRRQLTVMFCDLVGSTALAARLDPEDLHHLIAAYHESVARTVGRLDGYVARYMGDGVLVCFGYPQAHEDDAERAVRAALEVISSVKQLKLTDALEVRVGIDTGLVVVGDLTNSGDGREHGIVGETPNLAARLQAAAEPNTVVISPRTCRLLGDLYEYRDLGALELKGFPEPLHAYQILRRSVIESRFEALHARSLMPLVGRTEETALILHRWEQAKRGDGQAVLVSGEPGIGKSRLAIAIRRRLQSQDHTCLSFYCSPYYQDSSLHPVVAQIERIAKFDRDGTPERKLKKIKALLPRRSDHVGEEVALVADLLSVAVAERGWAAELSPHDRRARTLQALLAQVERLARRRPVLVVVEDAHWIDATSRELVDLLIGRASAMRLLLIITARPEFAPPWLGRGHVTLVSLSRLSPHQSVEMVQCH